MPSKKPAGMDIAIAGTLAVAVLFLYRPAGSFDFVHFDDDDYVVENTHVSSGLNLENTRWAFTTWHAGNWHPLTWLSLMADARWATVSDKGIEAGGFHRRNVWLHALNSVLVFLLFMAMTNERWPSLFVAALFATHPLHVESVVWIAERKDVLSTFFGILSLIAYVLYASRATTWKYVIAIVMFILSLLSKQMLVTFPAILLLLDFWPLRRFPFAPGRNKSFPQQTTRHLLFEKVPFAILSAIFCLIVVYAQRQGNAVRPLAKYSVTTRLANACISYLTYLKMTVWPRHLAFFYPYPKAAQLGYGVMAAIVIVAICVIAILFRNRYPSATVGWLWYMVTLLPVIGVIQVGDQAMADRYTYIPHLGLFAGIAWSLNDWAHKRSSLRAIPIGVGIAAAISTAWLTLTQIQVWRNSDSLFLHATEVTHDNDKAHSLLAYSYYQQRRLTDAIKHYDAALAIRPDSADYQSNLANVYLDLGQDETSLRHFREAERLDPNQAGVLNNLAWILATSRRADLRNPEEAIRFAERSSALVTPPNPALLDTLAVAYAAAGRFSEAVQTELQARQLAEARGLKPLVTRIDSRVELFRAGKPYVLENPK